jgi:uncharacterized protein YjbI with pentapeptide repeats
MRKGLIFKIAGIIVLIFLIALIIAGYWFNWGWTGFNEYTGPNVQQYQPTKTLWDWLQLLGVLAIPVVVGLGTIWFTEQRSNTEQIADEIRAENERYIALDNQRESALQDYINHMSELLLQEDLRNAPADNVIRKIARVRTLTVLRNLDPARKASVLVLLKEAGLINKEDNGIVSLEGADLSWANLGIANLGDTLAKEGLSWSWMRVHGYQTDLKKTKLKRVNFRNAVLYGASLNEADLSEAYLSGAILRKADLTEANLREARLRHTNMKEANLTNADLSQAYLYAAKLNNANLSGANIDKAYLKYANLEGSNLTSEQLATTSSLEGAILPDGSKHL